MKNIIAIILFFFSLSCEKSELTEFKETLYVSFEKADMPVYLYGNASSKKIILVIHGGPGGNGLEYRFGKWKDDLEKKYLMAYWDQRGQGMSQGKYDAKDMTIAQMTKDLFAVVRTLKQKFGQETQVILYGHSWGGMLGTAYMIQEEYQEEVTAWIESNGAHDIPLLNKEAIKMFREVSQEQIALGNYTNEWQEIADWSLKLNEENISLEDGGLINQNGFQVEQYLLDYGFIADPALGTWEDLEIGLFSPLNITTSYLTGLHTSNLLLDEVESTSLTNHLYKINKPCLILTGKYDFVVPAALGEDAFQKVSSKSKKYVLFERSGHSPMSNEQEAYTAAIVQFMEAL